jgi:transposase-like protein
MWRSPWLRSGITGCRSDLDVLVKDFRERPLDADPYMFVAADALTMKVREGGRVVKIAVMVATGVNADGYREILAVATSTAETGAGWNTFLKDLVARGLNGRTGHLRRARRTGRGDRGDPARRQLATVPHALTGPT